VRLSATGKCERISVGDQAMKEGIPQGERVQKNRNIVASNGVGGAALIRNGDSCQQENTFKKGCRENWGKGRPGEDCLRGKAPTNLVHHRSTSRKTTTLLKKTQPTGLLLLRQRGVGGGGLTRGGALIWVLGKELKKLKKKECKPERNINKGMS